MSSNSDVLIVGGGLAGLCCALQLHQSGLSFQVLEASDGVGGRVRTDKVEGYPCTYRILHALPMQIPPVSNPISRSHQIRPDPFVCGEYHSVASIQWAMVSGRQVAEAVIDWFRK